MQRHTSIHITFFITRRPLFSSTSGSNFFWCCWINAIFAKGKGENVMKVKVFLRSQGNLQLVDQHHRRTWIYKMKEGTDTLISIFTSGLLAKTTAQKVSSFNHTRRLGLPFHDKKLFLASVLNSIYIHTHKKRFGPL